MNDKVSVQVVTFGAMNFAMQQNYVPLVLQRNDKK